MYQAVWSNNFNSMKYLNKTSLALCIVALFSYLSLYNSSGSASSNGGRTNAPFDNGTCSSGGCHSNAGSFNPTTTVTLLSGTTPVTTYTSNTSYTLRIAITSSGTNSSTRYGFQAVSVKSGSPYNAINNWGTMPTGTRKNTTVNSRDYASHSTPLTSGTIDIPWTSPSTSTGNITFYAAGMVANNNFNNSGDNIATNSLTITPVAPNCTTPTLSPTITHVDCFGGQTGAISVTATGGAGSFSYDWIGPNGYTASTKDITGIKAGQYRLIVTATGGCKDTINPVVNQPPTLSGNIIASSPYCVGASISLSASATGGNGMPYSYSWAGPSGASIGGTQMISVNNAAVTDAGDYILTITDFKNCSIKDTVNIQVDSLPIADGIIIDSISNNTYKFSLNNSRYTNNILWEFGDGNSATTASATNTYSANGSFDVKVTISNHCGSDTLKTSLSILPQSIERYKHSRVIKIFPNPADGIVSITSDAQTNIQNIKLISLQGTVVYERGLVNGERTHINTSNYANGIYILRVICDGNNYTYPISIRH